MTEAERSFWIQLVGDIYGDLNDQLTLLIIRRLVSGSPPDIPLTPGQWKAERLLMMGAFTAQAQALIEHMTSAVPQYAGRLLYSEVMDADHEAAQAIIGGAMARGEILETVPASFERNVAHRIASLQTQALRQTNLVNTSLLRDAQTQYMQILNRAATQMRADQRGSLRAIKEASREMVDEGLTGFIDRGGRKWQPDTATEMILRTASKSAETQSTFARMDEMGADLLVVSAHLGARPLCSLDQGRVFSRRGFVGTVTDGNGNQVRVDSWANSTYGEPAGILGINCRHHISPFVAGVSVPVDEIPGREENNRRYKLEQKQRRLERELRYLKRKRDVAIVLGQDGEATQWRSKILKASKELGQYTTENNLQRYKMRERSRLTQSQNAALYGPKEEAV